MAKTHGAAGAALTETPREFDSRPRQGDPLEHQIVADRIATEPATQPIVAEDDAIAQRAYELYQARGGTHGADVDDWLQAEREIRGERPID
jgi:hypothetical protein